MHADLLIAGGAVVDGSGVPPFTADVAVTDDRIVAIGDLRQVTATVRLYAGGRVVAPGFIDAHAHSEVALRVPDGTRPKVSQGITTEILGQDGLSYAPLPPDRLAEQVDYLAGINGRFPDQPATFADFLRCYEDTVPQNVASLAPYGAIRVAVSGWANRPLTPAELDRARRLVTGCLDEGAVGVGVGLDYFPQSVASTAELDMLGEVVAARGSVLVAHTRNRELGIVDAVRELVQVGIRTGASVHVSHLRDEAALPVIDEALADGVDVTFDLYPYRAGSSLLTMYFPPWALAGGPVMIRERLSDPPTRAALRPDLEQRLGRFLATYRLANVGRGKYAELVGRTLSEAVDFFGGGLVDAVAELLLANDLAVGYVGGSMSESSLAACAAHPSAMGGTDGILVGQKPHPRAWGGYPRFLRRYVTELGVMSLPEAVCKLTGKVAARFGLAGRGVVGLGMHADIVIFDAARLRDRATYADPKRLSEGVEWVLVNGAITWPQDERPSRLAGRILNRKP